MHKDSRTPGASTTQTSPGKIKAKGHGIRKAKPEKKPTLAGVKLYPKGMC